ncbi:hypothetical protein DYB34_000360 [Aphanomyces astaci]|uniref:MSP domain-containing protein n=1 Tax=Aphanomyces astaci TaxID=112090 RepID=A0A3R6WH85_APHAT|nr:hypothetical protein DYB34_000360 [Aphanomyces astaci]
MSDQPQDEESKYNDDSAVLVEKVQRRLKERAAEQHRGRTNAVLELKANTEKAFADLCGKNEKRNADADALARSQDREFQELLAAGKNPYEVFRAREIAARAAKKLATQKKKIKETEMDIAAHMVHEAALSQKRDEADKRHAAYVRKYQKELGRKVVEDRTQNYMISRTGGELVDPTGRTFRIDPSQVTVMKDHSFGLGKSSVKSREQRDKSDVKRGFGVPKRSKLEEHMRVQALAKQKENLIEKQIVWRKEFVGRAFLADPEVLWFKDFDVGRPQTLRFTLTNVSNTFNHFKLLPFPDDTRDFFDVQYDLPGRMSAGMTCHIHVTFCARVNQDIAVELPAVAKTGYFSIPVKCTAKRVVPVLSAYNLTYSNIVVGETSKQVVILRNDGALPGTFRIVAPASTTATTAAAVVDGGCLVDECAVPDAVDPVAAAEGSAVVLEGSIQPPDGDDTCATVVDEAASACYASEEALLQYASSVGQVNHDKTIQSITTTCEGQVEAYGSCPIAFTFAPHRTVADLRQTFHVVFDSPSHVAPLEVTVVAQAVEVPLYVEHPIMDFKCCVYGKLYRNKLILRNRGKVAMKCQLKVPPYLHQCLEFLPNFGFVQGSLTTSTTTTVIEPGRLEIQVKFRPVESIWPAVLKRRLGWKQGDVVALPLQVLVPDQVLPVYFVLRVQLTSGELHFSAPSLSFGPCSTTQSVSQRLVLTNPSRLPQKFGFVHIPPEIRVEPNDGFGTLLPLETTAVTVFYSPLSATEFKSSLMCATTLNRTYDIPCTGHGISPALRFSETVITMGAVPVGQFVVHSVVCTNMSATSQKMEIALPPEATNVLHIRPLVATVEGHSSIRIEFEFRPKTVESFQPENPSDDGANVHFQVSRPDAVPGLVHPSHHEDDQSQPTKSEHSWSYALPSEPKSYHGTYNVLCFVDGCASQGPQSFRVNVSVIAPEISLKPDKIEFGQVAVGQTGVMKLQVINNSAIDLDMTMVPLHSVGPFSILNALRVVNAHGGLRTILVEFAPSAPLIFREDLVLQTARGDMRVSLHGEGVSPVLSITPADGKIHFKPVLAREKGYTEFSLLNSSLFPLKYTIKSLDYGTSHPNFNQTSKYTIVKMVILFTTFVSPDHERPTEYTTTFRVDVPNQTEDHVIVLQGRCWECQTYMLHPNASSPPPNEDVFELPLHVSTPLALADFVKKPPRLIQVEFGSEAHLQHVVIGSIGPQGDEGHAPSFSDGKSSTPTTFEVVFESGNGISLMEKYRKYFTLEPLKGTVSPGHETSLSIQFNPHVDEHESTNTSNTNAGSSELRILHWIRVTARVTLKGGYIPPVLGVVVSEQVVHLVLKARVLT